jgi:glycine oxidase
MPLTTSTSDCVVIGGGVIGLSIAYQLAQDGLSVTLLERGEPGREATWAGAGILPPASWYAEHPALDALAVRSRELHPIWSGTLRQETGVDNQYWRCGSLYFETSANTDAMRATFNRWRALGVQVDAVDSPLCDMSAWRVPGEAQLRNPRHTRALLTAVQKLGVRVITNAPVEQFDQSGDVINAVETPEGRFSSASFCLAAGCWTPGLAEQVGVDAPGKPVRGQMLLLCPTTGLGEPVLQEILHCPPYYIAPRRDGHVIVGATVEEVGFNKQTTETARDELLSAAVRMAPQLKNHQVERHWAGLRPMGGDDLPQIGPLPSLQNAWIATGHYRAGLQFSPATAELISAMIRGVEPPLPAAPYSPARFGAVSLAS